ncbi:MAG: DUF3108 domain-containing protein [Bacteroidota bacterium]
MKNLKNIIIFLSFFFLETSFFFQRNNSFLTHRKSVSAIDNTDDKLRTIKNDAFIRGEKLKYRMHYGFINAGEATIQITDENKQIGERNTFHAIGIGYSTGAFDWFFKVRDRFESYIDEEAIIPWLFIRRCNEGGYIINQNQIYNNYKNTVDSDEKKFDLPENIQDMLSAFYYARTIDFSNIKTDDILEIQCFMDNEVWPLKIKYVCKEIIKTDIGKIRCMKFRPVVQKGRIFKREEDMNAWITDDKNKIPVRAEAKILVGSISMDLIEYSGLANPLVLEK